MFIGRYHLTLESDSALKVPARFYEQLSGGSIITQGFDRNLWVLPLSTFQLLCKRINAMNIADPTARLLLRMILGHAFELELDQSGNVHIPENLRGPAELRKEIVLIGQGDYFEIWDSELWEKQEALISYDDPDRFSKLVIALLQ